MPTPRWSPWRPFPDPRNGGLLHAPFGPGVYELRDAKTGDLLLCGIGSHCAQRMTSLLPKGHGSGGRRNTKKRAACLRLLKAQRLEYRTLACKSREVASAVEKEMLGKDCYTYCT